MNSASVVRFGIRKPVTGYERFRHAGAGGEQGMGKAELTQRLVEMLADCSRIEISIDGNRFIGKVDAYTHESVTFVVLAGPGQGRTATVAYGDVDDLHPAGFWRYPPDSREELP